MNESIESDLRAHYAVIGEVDPEGRAKLLAKLLEEPQAPSIRVVRRQSRARLRAPLFIAAGAAILLAALLWFPRGTDSLLWADVSQKLGSTETLQYRWLQRLGDNRLEQVPRWNYATICQAKHRNRSDNWVIPDERSLPSAGTNPDSIGIGFEDVENRTLESYSFDYKGKSFVHSVIYRSVHYPALNNTAEEADAGDLLKHLTGLPPEAVMKRGRERKNGREVIKFEIIDLAKLKLSTMFGVTSAYIFVDVQSHLPVAIEGAGNGGHVSRIWAIEVNRSANSIFDVPPLPADVDAEENWTFWLPVGLWERDGGITIRLSGPDGDPIISESDFRSMGPYRGGEFESVLLAEGIEKLDRFIARNPGASVKIEIAGEPPIERKIFGRLSRQIGVAPVRLIGFPPVETWGK